MDNLINILYIYLIINVHSPKNLFKSTDETIAFLIINAQAWWDAKVLIKILIYKIKFKYY